VAVLPDGIPRLLLLGNAIAKYRGERERELLLSVASVEVVREKVLSSLRRRLAEKLARLTTNTVHVSRRQRIASQANYLMVDRS